MTDEIIAILDLWWWPYGGSNSWNPIIQYKKAMKRQQYFGMERSAPQTRTIPTVPTCEEEAEILLLFSVLMIIIISIEYIGIIY